ncbi:10400_t:CDS:2 [Entrophospora sp. SA101]|nr:10400_t:CDS:2 [Entrophospora sp. SA101]
MLGNYALYDISQKEYTDHHLIARLYSLEAILREHTINSNFLDELEPNEI